MEFFFPIFRRGRIVILAIFMDVHVIYFSSFLDLSLIKHGFFFLLCSFFSSRSFRTKFLGYLVYVFENCFFFSKIRIIRKTVRTQFFIVKNNSKTLN